MGLIRETIAKNIVRFRSEHNMSQKDFAKKLGVPQSRVSNWEHNANSPDIEMLFKICEILKIPLDRLYGVEDEFEYRYMKAVQLLEDAEFSTDQDEKDVVYNRIQIIRAEEGTVCTMEINQLISKIDKIILEADERKDNYIINRIKAEFAEGNF